MKETQPQSFDELRTTRLKDLGLMPNETKYPLASRENRMPNQFGNDIDSASNSEFIQLPLNMVIFEQ